MSGLIGQNALLKGFRWAADLPRQVINEGLQAAAQGLTFLFGGVLTYEKPVIEFFADFDVPASQDIILRAGVDLALPRNCVSIRFLKVVGAPLINVNGGGFRTLMNNDFIDGARVFTLQIHTAVGESLTLQANGTGD